MATRALAFDAARHLRSTKAQAKLLTDALETDDAGYIASRKRTMRSATW